MKQKSLSKKLAEGRCLGRGSEYVGALLPRESHSSGVATQIADPIANRPVSTLSYNELLVFWLIRTNRDVVEIQEQKLMDREIVRAICNEMGIPPIGQKNGLTIDFLVLYADGSITAFSVKGSRSELDPDSARNQKERLERQNTITRQVVEKRYCDRKNYEFIMIFADEIDHKLVCNIRSVMQCYDRRYVTTVDQMYRYLIAHGKIRIDMTQGYVAFAEIAKEHADEIQAIYKKEVETYEQP